MVVSSSATPELLIPTKYALSLSKALKNNVKAIRKLKIKNKSVFLGYKSCLYRNYGDFRSSNGLLIQLIRPKILKNGNKSRQNRSSLALRKTKVAARGCSLEDVAARGMLLEEFRRKPKEYRGARKKGRSARSSRIHPLILLCFILTRFSSKMLPFVIKYSETLK